MSNEYPERTWNWDPDEDTLNLNFPVLPTEPHADTLTHNTKPDSDETEVEKTLEFPSIKPSEAPYDKSNKAAALDKQPDLEELRNLTEYKEPRIPLRTRFAQTALVGAVGIGGMFWSQSPWGVKERMSRMRLGDFSLPSPSFRQSALGLGGAVLVLSSLSLGAYLTDSDQEHAARTPQTATSPTPPGEQEPAFPVAPSAPSLETPELALPSPTGLPSGQNEGIPISIPHPPVTRVPISKTTPQQPRATDAPARPQQEVNPATQPAPAKATAETRETLPSASASPTKPESTSRPSEQPGETSPPATKAPRTTPPTSQTTAVPTSSPTSKPSQSTIKPQSSPPTTSETNQSTITVRPSSSPSVTTTGRKTTSSLPSPKQSTTPRSSFSATSIPTPIILKPTSQKASE